MLRLFAYALFAILFIAAAPAYAYELCDRGERVTDVLRDERVRQRIVDVATEEWRRFGFQVLDFSSSEQEADLSPLLGFSVPLGELPPALVGQPKGRLVRIGFAENEYETIDAVRGYWQAVIPDPYQVSGLSLTSTAWSAAFVSWVMCRAGLSEMQFRRREAHVSYVGGAYADEAAYGDTAQNIAAFLARPAAGTPVRAGDLACFSSSNINYAELSAFADGSRIHAQSHCDIIVGLSHDGARILAIGGNVEQSVTMSVFASRREGENVYLKTPQEWPAARPFFAIMQLRARPDLASTVMIRYAQAATPVG